MATSMPCASREAPADHYPLSLRERGRVREARSAASPSTANIESWNQNQPMPELKWDETDFLDFFEVEPQYDEFFTSYSYEVERGPLRLLFTVWPIESTAQASLFHGKQEKPLFSIAAYVRGEARLIKEPQQRRLDLEDCIIAPSRFWYIEAGNMFDRVRFPVSVTMSMTVDPELSIDLTKFQLRT
jgi:hypothetical protein